MCGICGVFAPGGVQPGLIERMTETLVHRGPDESGHYVDDSVALGSRRLSILDLEHGRMPIPNEDRSVWVVQNGEIYNFGELRRDLQSKGHRFATRSDTEVLVHLYEDLGVEMFTRLRGMFALAIWDRRRETLLLGRDRIGKKPLYYAYDGRRLFFASEIKSLRQVPDLRLTLDWGAVNRYFGLTYIPDPLSIYREVRKLPPGHWLQVDVKGTRLQRYWDLDFEAGESGAAAGDLVARLREVLTDAVRVRLVSDVPVGAFLSGGIDSATVVAIMSQFTEGPVRTFSIGFDDRDLDELAYARLVARTFATDHHEEVLRPNAVELLQSLIEHFDEPFGDPSALPTLVLARMASQHVKVVLSGDGGDEAFAGYGSYRRHLRDEAWRRRVPAVLRRHAFGATLDAAARLVPGSGRLRRAAKSLRRTNAPFGSRYSIGFDSRERQRLFSPAARAQIGTESEEEMFTELGSAQRFADHLARALYVDTKAYLPGDILVKVDRTSMAHSLEVRAPFVDHLLLEFAASIPSGLKLRKGVSKFLLRELAKELLPRAIVERDKRGFNIPLRQWFDGELRDLLLDTLHSDPGGAGAFFDRQFLERMWREQQAGICDWSVQFWCLLVFRLWYQRFASGA